MHTDLPLASESVATVDVTVNVQTLRLVGQAEQRFTEAVA